MTSHTSTCFPPDTCMLPAQPAQSGTVKDKPGDSLTCNPTINTHKTLLTAMQVYIYIYMHACSRKKRKEQTTPFGINLLRSQVLYRAAQGHACSTYIYQVCLLTVVTCFLVCIVRRFTDRFLAPASSDSQLYSVCVELVTSAGLTPFFLMSKSAATSG